MDTPESGTGPADNSQDGTLDAAIAAEVRAMERTNGTRDEQPQGKQQQQKQQPQDAQGDEQQRQEPDDAPGDDDPGQADPDDPGR